MRIISLNKIGFISLLFTSFVCVSSCSKTPEKVKSEPVIDSVCKEFEEMGCTEIEYEAYTIGLPDDSGVRHGGIGFPSEIIYSAERELDTFVGCVHLHFTPYKEPLSW